MSSVYWNVETIRSARFRRAIFDSLHRLSHPGILALQRLVTARFVWPGIKGDVRRWARTCLRCQRAKVHQHTATPLATFATPDIRFDHVHIDLVGPLPPSNGFSYILTCINRFTRWPEAIPIVLLLLLHKPSCAHGSHGSVYRLVGTNLRREFAHAQNFQFKISTKECACVDFRREFVPTNLQTSVPSTLTTDRGRQFQSDLWSSLMKLLGTKRIHTTFYHPIANGLVERFHRQLKSALKAQQQSEHWVDALPLVLLGCRTAIKEDLSYTAAELLYGRLPGEFVSPSTQHDINPAQFVGRLKATMGQSLPSHMDNPTRSSTLTSVHHRMFLFGTMPSGNHCNHLTMTPTRC